MRRSGQSYPFARRARLASLAIAACAASGAAVTAIEPSGLLAGAGLGSLAEPIRVESRTGAVVERLVARTGQAVNAGDVIVALERARVDNDIERLETALDETRRRLMLLGLEARTYSDLAKHGTAPRSRVEALKKEIADIEAQSAKLNRQIADAGQELKATEIRAPVSGRIRRLAVQGKGDALAAGALVAEIEPSQRALAASMLPPELKAGVRTTIDRATRLAGRLVAGLRSQGQHLLPSAHNDASASAPASQSISSNLDRAPRA